MGTVICAQTRTPRSKRFDLVQHGVPDMGRGISRFMLKCWNPVCCHRKQGVYCRAFGGRSSYAVHQESTKPPVDLLID